eukprot:gene12284-biopygen4929
MVWEQQRSLQEPFLTCDVGSPAPKDCLHECCIPPRPAAARAAARRGPLVRALPGGERLGTDIRCCHRLTNDRYFPIHPVPAVAAAVPGMLPRGRCKFPPTTQNAP